MVDLIEITKFPDTNYTNVRFKHCVFQSFSDISFTNCVFDNCTFQDSTVLSCYFDSVKLMKVTGHMVKFVDTTISSTAFANCSLIGADFTKIRTLLITSIAAEDTNFSFAQFTNQKIPKSTFLRCNLRDADFTDATLKGSSFKMSDLERTSFNHADISSCNFIGAKRYFIDPKTALIKGSTFSQPDVMNLLDALEIKIGDDGEELS